MSGKTLTPKALAEEIGVDPKALRAYLRSNHGRQAEAKGTSWTVPADVAREARKHFAAKKAKATPATPPPAPTAYFA